jgi:osmotically-inducible protein OsmY
MAIDRRASRSSRRAWNVIAMDDAPAPRRAYVTRLRAAVRVATRASQWRAQARVAGQIATAASERRMRARGFAALAVAAVGATLVLSGCAAALMGRAASSGSSSGTTQSSSGGSQRAGGPASTTPSNTQRAGNATRSAAQIDQDRQVAASVRSKLSADAGTKALAVGVDAYQGVVSLHGEVANAGQRSAVERVARSVAGVRDVRNELRVR